MRITLVLTALLAMAFVAGCEVNKNSATPIDLAPYKEKFEVSKAGTEQLKQLMAGTADPVTRAYLASEIARRQVEEANVAAKMEDADKPAPSADPTLTALLAMIPIVGPYLVSAVPAWLAASQFMKRKRQVFELAESVERLGGPVTDAQRASLLSIQSDDTIAAVAKLKPKIKHKVAAKPAAAAPGVAVVI